jgi:hypothetical protein
MLRMLGAPGRASVGAIAVGRAVIGVKFTGFIISHVCLPMFARRVKYVHPALQVPATAYPNTTIGQLGSNLGSVPVKFDAGPRDDKPDMEFHCQNKAVVAIQFGPIIW